MKRNHLAAGLIGALLLTGSTVSIAAANMHKDSIKSKSAKKEVRPIHLPAGSSLAAWGLLKSTQHAEKTPSFPMPAGLDTATATIEIDDDSDEATIGTDDDSDEATIGTDDDSDEAINDANEHDNSARKSKD